MHRDIIQSSILDKGLRVFLSTVTLQALGVAAYKKAIDDALDSTSAVVVVGTSTENLDSPWVRYEWDSYLNDILTEARPSGRVFSYVKGISTRELPRPLRQTTSILHGFGSMARLYHFITNALSGGTEPLGSATPVPPTSEETVGPKLEHTAHDWSHTDVGPASTRLAGEITHSTLCRPTHVDSQPQILPRPYDIFLSCPLRKRVWVTQNLYPLISGPGRRIFFDASELDPVAGWIGQVADALERSRVFIPVYCPDYFNSDMCC